MDYRKQGRNNKRRGKAIEREVRDLLIQLHPGQLAWRNADNGNQVADVETDCAVYEVKSNQRPTPQRRVKAWSQAKEAERQTGKVPYVVETYIDNGKRSFRLVQQLNQPNLEKLESSFNASVQSSDQ